MQEGQLGVCVVAGSGGGLGGVGAAQVVKWRRLRGESSVQKRGREASPGWLWFLVPGAGEAQWPLVGIRKKPSKTAGVGEPGARD